MYGELQTKEFLETRILGFVQIPGSPIKKTERSDTLTIDAELHK
jgi:hypothetical protein